MTIIRAYRFAVAAAILLTALNSSSAAFGREEQVQEIARLMDAFGSQRHFSGVALVAQSGKVLFQGAYGLADVRTQVPNTVDTKFWIASMSKQFAAAVSMLLVQEGKLRLDDRISNFLPDYPKPAGDEITLHQLLTHTSGIMQDAPLQGAYAKNKDRYNTRDELRSYFQDSSLLFSPGTGFQYSNYNYNLIVMMMEKTSATTYRELLRTRVFAPIGMNNSGVEVLDSVTPPYATGYTYGLLEDPEIAEHTHPSMSLGAGDMYTTVGDLYLWDQALSGDEFLSDSLKHICSLVHERIRLRVANRQCPHRLRR